MSYFKQIDLATNDLGRDAWGRPKMITDRSILHGMFTYNVPITVWEESINSVIQSTFLNATSEDGHLKLLSGATLNDLTRLRTFRNPRYEPNRGHLYSTSIFLPTPSALGNRRWGFFNAESGAFFSLESGSLYAVVRTTLASVTTDDKYLIDITGIDLSKGNTYDIQMQWRGVGNYKFYINSTEVKVIEYIGTLTELTTFNPANPIAFECENLGANVEMNVGCVDVTSEGGGANGKTYGSISVNNTSGELALTGFNAPVLAVRSKLSIGGLINTRDTLSLLATAYADQRSFLRIWSTRDFTAITDGTQTWSDFGDGNMEYVFVDPGAGTPITFNTAKAELIFGSRIAANTSYEAQALFENRAFIHQTPGDMFVFTIHRDTGLAVNGGVTYEFAEEI